MEEEIRRFRKSLGTFCNHLESNCDALKQSLDRRPIPLDSVSSSFIKCLNRRVSSASADLNVLDSMTFGTVSFEELLGHCNEVYKKNQSDLVLLQDRLQSFGYHIPEVEIGEEEEEFHGSSTPNGLELKDGFDPPSSYCGLDSLTGSIMKSLEEDSLLDECLSLKKLGLSDACLATLASEANGQADNIAEHRNHLVFGEVEEMLKSVDPPKPLIKVSNDDYESLPSYMKGLAPWEDLLDAVEKINSSLSKKEETKGSYYFHQDEISSFGLGPKARSYLLLLVRMNRLVVETIDGLLSYRVL